jgi:hypothetical protein
MAKRKQAPPELANESTLERLTGTDRHQLASDLVSAGIKPVKVEQVGRREIRWYVKADALKALTQGAAGIVKDARDRGAHAKAEALEIKAGVAKGKYVAMEVFHDVLGDLIMRVSNAVRILPNRVAHGMAHANANATSEQERRKQIAAVLDPEMEEIIELNKRKPRWPKPNEL